VVYLHISNLSNEYVKDGCPREDHNFFVPVREARPCGGISDSNCLACIDCKVRIPITGRVVPNGKETKRVFLWTR
jgi:hypothetical protein